MNDPSHLQGPTETGGVPPPPPGINSRRLWLTLLVPPAVMVAVMLVLLFAEKLWASNEAFITVTCGFSCLVAVICWGVFIHTISLRFHGTSLVLLILAYPLLQAVLLIAIFFAGCLAIIYTTGY